MRFPNNFFWGTATSAHQIEGNNTNNDWWEAEQRGKIPHTSGRACDSYNRYEEDFDLAKQMHNNAHRFSIEWSRIEPIEGLFDKDAIEHYRKVLQALRARGLEPFVTLHHITNPLWFAKKGGWTNKKSPMYFARYAKRMAEEYGDLVQYWITINEPDIWNAKGYVGGSTPPFHTFDILGYRRAQKNMARAHIGAYKSIRKASGQAPQNGSAIAGQARVGIAQNQNYLEPAVFPRALNAPLARALRYFRNFMFLDRVKEYQDFVGVNYYNHYKISILRGKYQDKGERSDFGWEIFPAGIYHVVGDIWKQYRKPIFVLENGIADANDSKRADFIKGHLAWLRKAIEEGADVRGYFYWSLLDNFEWAAGFTQRFGLAEVNFDTFERATRPSAKVYGEICKNNGFERMPTNEARTSQDNGSSGTI